ncbi:MAG: Methyltransferase type 11 [Symbiobacteriaceae bacterium]|jgi:ubiquinone/menaquinone biosynthesis C-methylase UbiE|nr:Methyltransferase type 11 [Symbiobacteriaceae bacterium]
MIFVAANHLARQMPLSCQKGVLLIVAQFDKVADIYDATRGFARGVDGEICQWILQRLTADPAITEIGVGTGRVALPFIAGGVRYTGIDVAEGMVDVLQAKLGGDLRRSQLYVGDVHEGLPVADASQDAVVAVAVMHLLDPARALAQVRRVLKPHGALIWGEDRLDPASPRARIRSHYIGALPPASPQITGEAHRRILGEWGATATRHTVATWQFDESPATALESLRQREQSFTWVLDDAAHAEAVRRTEARARQLWPDLERPVTQQNAFVVDWYQC